MRSDEDQIRRTGDQVNGEAGQLAIDQFEGEHEELTRRTRTIAPGLKGGTATARHHHQPSIPFHAKSKASG
ncbi:MAG: hypothetical protein CVV64_16530 [Candidatus Wallbacteria bacterium HGW-Wallbacteria-1]|uniref:Uncharacterized protein n=1 Tax=Candidatus Wallbacteria bacterium HGW-Wallbacteria-1 TaxID=2013854 RepID=A0A2N1PKR4_9BACT|nr:MAG: hypothetical protein CVV64_16530 [Candidatus Wallbacteria bacterium HGW-Wallbacteria-1]